MRRDEADVLRVLVVDDDDLFARAISQLVATEEDLELVGRAHDGREGIELARTYRPDAIVMDVHMPVLGGLEAARKLHELDVDADVLLVSGEDVSAHVDDPGAVGAVGYLPKSAVVTSLVTTLRAIGAARRRRFSSRPRTA
jgi:DNA-binding NarL/FixJ family response regulator